MKGPGLRIDVDVRRVWRCPRCGRVAKRLGDVTAQHCSCSDEGAWMKLEGAPPLRTFPRPAPFERTEAEDNEPEELTAPVIEAPPETALSVDSPPENLTPDATPASNDSGLE